MSAQSLKVLIVAGGLTHERDVSVRSGRRVANSLVNQGFAAKVVDFDQNLPSAISDFQPDVIWPLVHGSIGEDGSLQTLLEGTRIPYPRVDCASPASVPPAWCTECPEDD